MLRMKARLNLYKHVGHARDFIQEHALEVKNLDA